MRALASVWVGVLLSSLGCSKQPTPPAPRVPAEPSLSAPAPRAEGQGRLISMEVTTEGFVPADVRVKAKEPVVLRITRTTDETCATEILIAGTDINVPLPLGKSVDVAWTPSNAGAVKYGCAMDKMVGGVLLVE